MSRWENVCREVVVRTDEGPLLTNPRSRTQKQKGRYIFGMKEQEREHDGEYYSSEPPSRRATGWQNLRPLASLTPA